MPCKHLAICSPQPQWDAARCSPIGNWWELQRCNGRGNLKWILRFCGLGDLVECPICRSQQVVPGGLWDVSVLALSLALPYPSISQLQSACIILYYHADHAGKVSSPLFSWKHSHLNLWHFSFLYHAELPIRQSCGVFKSKQIVGGWTYSIDRSWSIKVVLEDHGKQPNRVKIY